MTINYFRINAECQLFEKPHKIISVNPPDIWLQRIDGEHIKYNILDLLSNPSFSIKSSMITKKQAQKSNYYEISKLNSQKRDEIGKRFKTIHPLLLHERILNGDLAAKRMLEDQFSFLIHPYENIYDLKQRDLIQRIIEKTSLSRATIMRYLKSYRTAENGISDGLEGLISNQGRGYTGRNDDKLLVINHPQHSDVVLDTLHVRLNEDQIAILKLVIEKEYLTKLRVSVAYIDRMIKRICMEQQVITIHYNTLCSIIRRIDKKAKETMRNYKKSKQIYENVTRGYADREALGRLDIVQMDHTRLDMQIIDDVTGLVIDRPWLTLGICVYSRESWCMYISHESPSANIVTKAIQHGVFMKNTKKEYQTQQEWIAFGIPNIIYVDNGVDFKSKDVRRLVNETLKSELRHRPVKLPQYGAIIERFFGTINRELLHNIVGTTKSNIFQKGELEPEKETVLSLSQLQKIIVHYLVDIYPFEIHRGIGVSPRVKYMESLNEMGYPPIIFDQDKEKYQLEFMQMIKRPYTRDGVRWENRLYKSLDCNGLIGDRTIKYMIKYDADDISSVYLLHPKHKEFIRLCCESPPYETVVGVNRYTYKKLEKKLKLNGELKSRSLMEENQINKAWRAITEEVTAGYVSQKSIRQKVARMDAVKIELVSPIIPPAEMPLQKEKNYHSVEDSLFLKAKQAEQIRKGEKL